MHHLVGLRGKRYFFLLNLLQLVVIVALSIFAFLFLLADRGLINVSPWYASLTLVPGYAALIVLIGMFWWALSGTALRLDQGLWHLTYRKRVIPALGAVLGGILVTHAWLIINQATDASMTLGLEFLPAVLGCIAAAAVLSTLLMRTARSLKVAKNGARVRQELLVALKSKFNLSSLERISVSCDVASGRSSANPVSSPIGKVLYGLSSKPWYERSDFSWIQTLEDNYDVIRKEALGVLEANTLPRYDYPGVAKEGWKYFPMVHQGKVMVENCQKCPGTWQLLRELPRFPHFRDAMFSLLEPGRYIPPHQDTANVYLTCHLGIRVPDKCGIDVAGRVREWKEGQCIVFDSSYLHSAWNHSSESRLVLLIDFLHPEINDAEFEWLDGLGV